MILYSLSDNHPAVINRLNSHLRATLDVEPGFVQGEQVADADAADLMHACEDTRTAPSTMHP